MRPKTLQWMIALVWTALALTVTTGATLRAQGPPEGAGNRGRFAQNNSEAIKTTLDLTDRQFMELTDIRTAYLEKMKEITQQIAQLEKEKAEILRASGADPVKIGSITLQIQALQQNMKDETAAYRVKALTVFTGAQREKIHQIEEALKLAPQAGALFSYGLLDTEQFRGRQMGGPGMGMMMRGPGGARPGPGANSGGGPGADAPAQ